MNWTSEKPTVEGWYWFRENKLDSKVVFVRDTGTRLLFGDNRLPSNLDAWPGEWAGPIQEPADGQKTPTNSDYAAALRPVVRQWLPEQSDGSYRDWWVDRFVESLNAALKAARHCT